MIKNSSLELPIELKRRIKRVAKERNEESATLLASAIDSLLSAADTQLAEVHRRDLADRGHSYSSEEAFARLDSFRPSRRTPSAK